MSCVARDGVSCDGVVYVGLLGYSCVLGCPFGCCDCVGVGWRGECWDSWWS